MKDIDTLLKEVKRIHFIGIGGSGMCPLAEILLSLGYQLSGSDNNDTETFRRIEKEGAKVYLGQTKANLTPDIQLVIYTNAILKGNEELEWAKAHYPCFERAELLGAMSRIFSNCIGISGTHGKTTTSSMTTQVLLDAGLDPSAVIGGKLPAINAYGRYGHSQNFVCESCEYNNTFLHMNPDIAVVLNIDRDHLDFFGDLEHIQEAFIKFANKATRTVIYNGDDANTVEAMAQVTGKKMITFGTGDHCDWQAKNIHVPGGFHSDYDVYHNGQFLCHAEICVPGAHNILNSLAAFAAAYESGAKPEDICRGLKDFHGAHRRFELTGTYYGVTFADDYGHHPTELQATLRAAMQMGYKRVWAVHQPFTFSRTSELLDDFARVLQIPDKCVISAIMGSREVNTIGIHAKDLADKIPGAVQLDTFPEIAKYVTDHVEPGDLVLTLGCGDVYKVNQMMVKIMKDKEANAES